MTFNRKLNARNFGCLLIALGILTCNYVNAAEESVSVNGYGADQKRAIADGLVQGIRQLKGVAINSTEVLDSLSVRSSTSRDGEENSSAVTAINQSGTVSIKTQGLVSRYEVHSMKKQGEQSYQAELSVYILKYEKPGLPAEARRKLAVLPFHLGVQRFHLLGDSVPAHSVEEEFRNKLIDQFTQSRRVNVLDREFKDEFSTEKAIWMSGDANVNERAKLGNVLGVDYLVVGNLRKLSSRKKSTVLELTGETLSHYSGSAQLDYKIILAASRQVKWSDTIRVKFNDKQIRNMLAKFGSSQAGITQYLASTLSQTALANIYPIRVVAIKGKMVVLNQGGKTLKKGERLDVFLLGDEMFDPYTKESLGQIEDKVAEVKIVRVNAKTTYAKVVNGDADLIEKGFIARR